MNGLKNRFIELFSASGWSQAEVARRLEMTRGGVNGIVTGDSVPSAAAVKLFEMILSSEGRMPHVNHALREGESIFSPDEMELVHELRRLDPAARDQTVECLLKMLALLPKRKVRYSDGSSPKPQKH